MAETRPPPNCEPIEIRGLFIVFFHYSTKTVITRTITLSTLILECGRPCLRHPNSFFLFLYDDSHYHIILYRLLLSNTLVQIIVFGDVLIIGYDVSPYSVRV